MIDFSQLVARIQQVHTVLSDGAKRAINSSLTLRNWVIGFYISEYELNGEDRAAYGDNLMADLAAELQHLPNCNRRQLYDYRTFYSRYPQIVQTVSALLPDVSLVSIGLSEKIVQTVSAQSSISPMMLVQNLSYSMFRLLAPIEEDTKRLFYEVEVIQGNWSVRELKRQIDSLYYERSGLSVNKQKLKQVVQGNTEHDSLALTVKDPFVFEFIGLKAREVMGETHLEELLLDHIESFLLELGHGFCFEARQKRIVIGETYNFVDLVFYHRILKCHVLVELKVGAFNHENIGQLNTYVSWYRKNVMVEGDGPPVGILLCTNRDKALVEYATAGMDNTLFVSRYQLELPAKEEMERFISQSLREMGGER